MYSKTLEYSLILGDLPTLEWLKNNITDNNFSIIMNHYYKKRKDYKSYVCEWLEKNYSD